MLNRKGQYSQDIRKACSSYYGGARCSEGSSLIALNLKRGILCSEKAEGKTFSSYSARSKSNLKVMILHLESNSNILELLLGSGNWRCNLITLEPFQRRLFVT